MEQSQSITQTAMGEGTTLLKQCPKCLHTLWSLDVTHQCPPKTKPHTTDDDLPVADEIKDDKVEPPRKGKRGGGYMPN